MKSPRQAANVPGVRSYYHGRHTLERICRRIAASNVVGTLTARVSKKSHGSRRSSQGASIRAKSSASSIHPDHPQSGVLQKRSHQLSKQRMERAKSRRKARERQLQKVVENVWENDVSSGSEEVLRNSNDSLNASSIAEEISTDDSFGHLNMSARSRSKKSSQHELRSGCLPVGYIPQLMCAAILSLGNLNIGFMLAYHSIAPVNHLPTNSPNWLAPWILNLFNLGGLLGALLSSLALNKGRKRPLMVTVLILIASWLMVILSHNSSMIFGARLIGGIAAGIITVVNQIYIAELASPRQRGSLGVLPTCFGLIGTLLCFGLSYGVSWRDISITGAALNGPYLLLLLFYLPDSPRYLLRQGKIPSAAASLKRLASLDQLSDMRDAYDLLKLSGHDGGLLKKPFMLPVSIAGGLMFFSQFSGVDSVLTYAADKFRDHSNFPIVVLYGVQLITALICFGTVDRKGRKWLLLVSAAASALSMLSLGLYVLCEDIGVLGQTNLRWIPVSCVILYCGAFALGLGPIPWLILGELLPIRSHGTATAITAGLFWGPSLVVTMSFGDMQNAMYLSGTFWFYTIFCLFGYLFVLLVVPDIRPEATLEQIQIFFMASDKREHDQWSFAVA
ncbi:Sugar transporter [Daphnia magna]|uniref:Sugar transporter n=1 Tax=Daphnia magna TaxID=35525 RepID=A0A162SME4_9CRUS|nr:Sugar transporter [Daphnia magna]